MLGFNLSVGRNRQSFGDADAQAFIAATGLTGTTETTAVRRLVANLKTYGLWSKMKAIYPFVSDTNNLFSYSEDFTNPAWTKSIVLVTGNTTTAPDGTNTADTIQNQGSGYLTQSNVALSSGTYTQSIFVKKNNNDWVAIYTSDAGSNYAVAWFNLNTGVKGTVSAVGTFSSATSTMTAEANGFYRCSITFTKPTTVNSDSALIVPNADNTFTRTVGQNAYIWGAQFQTSSLTTYQPIATTPANRFVSQFKYNLKDPRDLDAAFRLAFSGTWTYSQQGATGNGVNGYANSYFNVASNLTTFSSSMSVYSRTDIDSTSEIMGCDVGGFGRYFRMILRSSNLGRTIQNGTGTIASGSVTNSQGFFIGNRSSSTKLIFQKNSSILATNTTTETSLLPSQNVFIGAYGNNGSPTAYAPNQIAFSHIGDGLTDTEASNLYTSVQLFQQDLSRQVGVPIVSDSDAQSFLNAAVITDTTQANAINTLVVGLKNASLWTKMKAIYPFVGGTATTHKWNLKDPRDLDAAYRLAFNGAWTHSSTGALPNGANAFANTYLNPTTTFADKPLGIGAYVNTVSTFINDKHIIGAYSGASNYSSIQVNSSTAMQFNMYAGFTATLSASPSARGYMLWTNNGTTAYAYVNNQSTSSTLNGTNRPNVNYSLGGINVNGTTSNFVNNQFCAGYITDYLTSTESNNFYTLLQSFQTTLGRQV